MKKLINQILKFGVVGLVATIIDYVLLVIFTEFFHIPSLISAAMSFTISVIFNYIASVKFVFYVKTENINKEKQILIFIILSIIGLLINEGIMWILDKELSIHYTISKLFATAIVMCWNFITRKFFLEDIKIQK